MSGQMNYQIQTPQSPTGFTSQSIHKSAIGYKLEYYENGTPKSNYNLSYGKPDGLCKEWHPNGAFKSLCRYKPAINAGSCTEWYQDGKIAYEVEWKEGRKIGKEIEYHPNGRTASVVYHGA